MIAHTIQKIVLITLLALSPTVFADDKINWAGLSVGINTGISNSSYNLKPINNSLSTAANVADCGYVDISRCTTWNQKPKTAVFGMDASYDFQRNDYVYGLGIRYLNLANATATNLSDINVRDDNFNTKIEKNYQITGRFGKAIGNNLIYIKAGISFADVKFDVIDEVDNPVSGNRYGSKWFHGGLVGLGLDHKFNDNLIFGAEFNHISYASENISATGTSSAGLALKDIYSPKNFHSENVIFNLRYLF
ncbi:COG3637 Opacity protein and related surface antigens [Methylophilaceae bacterium]